MNWVQYPIGHNDDGHYDALLYFKNCDGILIEGTGKIDGQGFMWWIREILQKNLQTRPYIIKYYLSRNLEVRDVLILNSPYYHIVPYDCENIYMHDFEIYVDIWG
jgi:polygalacturonase